MVASQSMGNLVVPQLPVVELTAVPHASVVALDPPRDLRPKPPQPQWEYTFAEFTQVRSEWRLQSPKTSGEHDGAKLGPDNYSKWMGLEGWELVNVVLLPSTTTQPKRASTKSTGATSVGTLMLVFKRAKL